MGIVIVLVKTTEDIKYIQGQKIDEVDFVFTGDEEEVMSICCACGMVLSCAGGEKSWEFCPGCGIEFDDLESNEWVNVGVKV